MKPLPKSLEELRKLNRIPDVKVKDYGEELLELFLKFEESDHVQIEKEEEMESPRKKPKLSTDSMPSNSISAPRKAVSKLLGLRPLFPSLKFGAKSESNSHERRRLKQKKEPEKQEAIAILTDSDDEVFVDD